MRENCRISFKQFGFIDRNIYYYDDNIRTDIIDSIPKVISSTLDSVIQLNNENEYKSFMITPPDLISNWQKFKDRNFKEFEKQQILKYLPKINKIGFKYSSKKNVLSQIYIETGKEKIIKYDLKPALDRLNNEHLDKILFSYNFKPLEFFPKPMFKIRECLTKKEMLKLVQAIASPDPRINCIVGSSNKVIPEAVTFIHNFNESDCNILIFLLKINNRWITLIAYKESGKIKFFYTDAFNQPINENNQAKKMISEIKNIISSPSKEPESIFKKPEIIENEYVLEDLSNEITNVIRNLNNPKACRKFRQQIVPILFFGPPGTGKSTLAKLIASKTKRKIYITSGADLLDKFYNGSTEKIKKIFKEANDTQGNVIIFIDEIEAIVNTSTNETARRDSCTYLNMELNKLIEQYLQYNYKIFFIAATNKIDLIDEATLSRFEIINMPLPDMNKRLNIIKKIRTIKNIIGLSDPMVQTIANKTEGWSIREIERIFNNAGDIAIKNEESIINESHVAEAFVTYLNKKSETEARKKKEDEEKEEKRKIIITHKF